MTPKTVNFSTPKRTSLDNTKRKALDFSRAFGLIRMVPDFQMVEVVRLVMDFTSTASS
jgi:hypothetical protein